MTKVALVGAGGKMGARGTNNLKDSSYEMMYVEVSEQGIANLTEKGLKTTPMDEAVAIADAIIFAVPDVVIGKLAREVVPNMKSGAMLITLDPAAARIGHLPKRADITYFVVHPCHPPIYNDEMTREAKADLFGGVAAKQAIVCALMQGPEEDYQKGEEIAKAMFAPILRTHRINVEQMAILEPAMAETVLGTCVTVLREAMDEAVKRGVPLDAAKDFMIGHLNIELAIAFDLVDSPFSDAALVAIEYGKKKLLNPNWREIFEPDKIEESIHVMLNTDKIS